MENNKKVAKNTLVLYIRQLLIMILALYTSRVILKIKELHFLIQKASRLSHSFQR